MKIFINTPTSIILTTILVIFISGFLNAQFTVGVLPPGKSIVITYEVDVNANACPTGSLSGGAISNQSNVSGGNFATVQTDDPDNPGTPNATLTDFSALSLGDFVYRDNNQNGVFDAGDVGINGVLMNLYLDNGDGMLTVADGSPITTGSTAGGGLYSFSVCSGVYILEVAPSNFNSGGALYNIGLPLISSPVGGAPDPDDDINNDDNGDPIAGFGVAASAITVAYGAEPTSDGDADNNTNLSLDFGFKTPDLDFGDAPISYSTLNVNNGARHVLSPGGLVLGSAVTVDSDGQPSAAADADADDGVTLPAFIITGTNASITVIASAPGLLNAWVDFNRDGDWGEVNEQIFTNEGVVAGANSLSFIVPSGADVGTSFARFRLSNDAGLSFTGTASDGEVEDYAIEIVDCNISISNVMIAHETCDGANDGALTITAVCASCTNGGADIRYSIDGIDFTNTTGIFTGLADGIYTVTVRDMNNITCTATQVVMINQGSTPTVGGNITSNTVCTPANTSTLMLSGHTGNVVKWQSSANILFTSPMDIVNNTSSLTVTNISTDTYYRAIVKSGTCAEAFSDTGAILYVNPEVTYNGNCYTSLANALAAVPMGDPATIEVWVNITPPEINIIPFGVTIQVNPGATWINMMSLTNNGQIVLIGNAAFINGISGLYKGKGSFSGNFVNNGKISPGN